MDARPRILGVDDSLTIRRALEIVLKPAGYDLELAADGAEAIEKAKSLKPALILLDFILPDMHGTDVCRRLAADPDTAGIPVVLISAKGAEIRQAYRDVGNVVSYIAKPFKPQVVTSVVADVLAQAAAGELVKLNVPGQEGVPSTLPPFVPAPSELAAAAASPNFIRPEAPANGDTHVFESDVIARGNGHDEARDDIEEVEIDGSGESQEASDQASGAARRETLELMFETLRAGLEGVYVEEVDTPAGAAADQAKTYTDLVEQLSDQLDETLRHARSAARYTLCGDGSVRSLDETLLDVFRRSCRLLFRAAVAGAVGNETTQSRHRILVACHREGRLAGQLRSMLSAHPDWQSFVIVEGFRHLPMATRLYAPTHVIAEVTGSGALWDQLRVLQRMPEARAMNVIGIVDSARPGVADGVAVDALAERGITRVVHGAFEIEGALTGVASPEAETPVVTPTFDEMQAGA